GTDYGGTTGDDNSAAASGDQSGSTSSSSGSSSSGSSSSSSGSGKSGTSSGSKSGSSSGSTGGSSGSSSSAADAPSDHLPVPEQGTGMQVVTPDYNAADPNAANMIVQPGQEIFLCYYVTLPNTGEVDVGAFQSWMSPYSSHHFIVFQGGSGAFAGPT